MPTGLKVLAVLSIDSKYSELVIWEVKVKPVLAVTKGGIEKGNFTFLYEAYSKRTQV
jgi:hypothetical protein